MENMEVSKAKDKAISESSYSSESSCDERETEAPPEADTTFDTTEMLTKQPDELVTYLVENLTRFTKFISPPLPSNAVVQLVQIMEKVCAAKETIKLSNTIFSRLHKNFMQQLEKYFLNLSLDDEDDKAANKLFWTNPEAFWNSLLVVFENVIDRLQKTSTIRLEKVIKASIVTILFHKNSHGIELDDIAKKLASLSDRLGNEEKISSQSEEECKDHYKSMNVFPNPTEVLTRKKPFLRQNIIDGGYTSVEDYLDTHFRLLREDFLGPLREAICSYKDSLKNNERVNITEFRIYSKTRFVEDYLDRMEFKVTPSLSYIIENRVRRRSLKLLKPGECNKKFVNHEEAFIPGGLLCFSHDDFQTMFFGISAKLLRTRDGLIDVQLLEDVPFLEAKEYTMLDCCNYFGTYSGALASLKRMDTKHFPMEKYIINVVNDREAPEYLTNSSVSINDLEFKVLDDQTWPTKEELNLNEMQYGAFKQALQSKCALIQGPPGTGKTYLGLKILQTLIESRTFKLDVGFPNFFPKLFIPKLSLNEIGVDSPILVVAHTNHALDQILEGLIPYTKSIVRIGHQGTNSKIDKFRLQRKNREGNINKYDYKEMEEIIIKKEKLMRELESVVSYGGIFNIRRSASVVPEVEKSPVRKWSKEIFIRWLLGTSSEQQRRDRQKMANEIGKNFESNNTYIPSFVKYEQTYILTLSSLKSTASKWRKGLDLQGDIQLETLFFDWNSFEERYKQIQDNVEYLEWRLKNATGHINLYAANPIDGSSDLHKLSDNERWILYFHWLDSYAQYLKGALRKNDAELQSLLENLEFRKQLADSEQIKRATVVGMTTSGAAKHRYLLQLLECRIVLVEEAAEVLESHIIVSLMEHCQHLILIGDHQQLRPITSDYQIENEYQLGISLFERLIRNKISYSTLDIQHRMRPEISRLIVPAIYENLQNHPSVNDFPNIKGIKHNVFFITHSHQEIEIGNSRKNVYEAKYLIALARHLILQGYYPNEITILATYKGQMYAIKEEQKKRNFAPLQNVRVTVVDNFQGEENQIILLSLVRSNAYGSIGFLRIENRVCVALSRAKKGFYMIGNMDILTSSSEIWRKINDVLEKNQQIGPGLEMACQLHPENAIIATKPEDFLIVLDGGCHLPCKAKLICGHGCGRKCYVTDNHQHFQCTEPCVKIVCSENHQCTKKCWEDCGPCQFSIERTLSCGHVQMVPCSVHITRFQCLFEVETLLRCKHLANKPCSDSKYSFKCQTEVEEKIRRCGHLVKKKCHEYIYSVTCNAVATVKLNCGHEYEHLCSSRDSKITCDKKCLKNLKCGHVCEKICHYGLDGTHSTPKYRCTSNCTKLKVGCKTNHQCELPCLEPCQPCQDDTTITFQCGYSRTIPCQKSDRNYACNEVCKKTKPCGHVCYRKCHMTCDTLCSSKVSKSFPNCGHKMKVKCSDDLNGKECVKCSKT